MNNFQLDRKIEMLNKLPWFSDSRFASVEDALASKVWDESKLIYVDGQGYCSYVQVGETLTVVPLKELISLDSVDNTADIDKPCSTYQDAAYKEMISELATAGVICQEGYEYIIPSTCELDVDADLPTVQIGRSFSVSNKSTLTQSIGSFSILSGVAASFIYQNGAYIEYSNNL